VTSSDICHNHHISPLLILQQTTKHRLYGRSCALNMGSTFYEDRIYPTTNVIAWIRH